MPIKHGFQTSVSVEPMLDSANIDTLIGELLPYVTHSIWIGKMNHLGRFGKDSDMVLQQAIEKIKRGQTDSIIKSIYRRYKDNPMIRWKKEIKKMVGIPLAEKPVWISNRHTYWQANLWGDLTTGCPIFI